METFTNDPAYRWQLENIEKLEAEVERLRGELDFCETERDTCRESRGAAEREVERLKVEIKKWEEWDQSEERG